MRGIANITLNWLELTRLYNIIRSPERVLSVIRE